jgi:F-box-like
MSLIFGQCESGIRPRLTLTHTCRRWRHIAVNDASLWSHVYIQTGLRNLNTRLDHFLSLLGMQLDRTGKRPLDVEWIAGIGHDFLIGTLQIIREKAPFSRWRSLKAYVVRESHKDAPWSSLDAFTNLETLQVYCGTDYASIGAIDRTVTSRLKVLELCRWPASELEDSMTSFATSFTHISTFIFGWVTPAVYTPILRENIVHLRLGSGEGHLFPHIRTYEVEKCIFNRMTRIDLRNMTVLTVTGCLKIEPDCQVSLPALRELKLQTLQMAIGTKLETPALDALHFTNINYTRGHINISLVS